MKILKSELISPRNLSIFSKHQSIKSLGQNAQAFLYSTFPTQRLKFVRCQLNFYCDCFHFYIFSILIINSLEGGDRVPSYLEHLILSMYQEPTNTGQVHNVLTGRSTPSILYLTEIKNWKHLYGILPRLSRHLIDNVQDQFVFNKLVDSIDSDGNKYQLTPLAKKLLEDFFKEEFVPKKISSFMAYDLRSDFWLLVCFFSQVVSEKAYKNTHYTPLKKDITSQLFLKDLIRREKDFDNKWIKEQIAILKCLDSLTADFLANTLLGHGVNASTLNQLARSLEIHKDQVYVKRFAAIYDYFDIINSQDHPLHQKILNFSMKNQGYGLTSSALDTLELLQSGYNLNQISLRKRIKLSTVKEHILEIAFKLPQINLSQLIPSNKKQEILTYFKTSQDWQYRNAKEGITDLEFYHYRLVELELLRNGG